LGADGSATLTLPPGEQITFVASTTLFSGDVRVTGEATAGYGTGDQVTLQRHTHGGVQTGGGTSGPPTPGT
jgi:phage baseplate assembly protein gpV